MKAGYFFVGLALLVGFFPYIRCFFKRMICCIKIKGVCDGKRVILYKNSPLWFLGSRYGKKCDFYIETEDEVFSVKLFGMLQKRSKLVIREGGDYFIRRFIGLIYYGTMSATFSAVNGKSKKIPEYDFGYKYKSKWEKKQVIPVLLVNPVCAEFVFQPNQGAETVIEPGTSVNGKEITSLPYFLARLNKLSPNYF